MKKLLYAGLTTLMMLFVFGTAKAAGTLPSGSTEDASFFTFSPASGSTVAPGTVLTITAESNWIVYIPYASQAEADAATVIGFQTAEEYGLYHEPIIQKDQCVFLIAANVDGGWKYTYVSYTVNVGDIDYPTFYVNSNYITNRRITVADEISIIPEDDDENTQIWYTTDGSDPAKNTGTEYTGKFTLDKADDVVVKAIAVNSSDQTSAIVEAHFTVVEAAASAQLYLLTKDNAPMGDTYGKYVAFMAMPMVGEDDDLMPAGEVADIFYTIDGTTEPDEEAFYEQTSDEGPIFRAVYYYDEENDEPVYPYITLTQNATTLKILGIAYDEMENSLSTGVQTYSLTATEVTNPSFNTAEGTVDKNTVVKVESASDYDMIYYTTDGSVPEYVKAGDYRYTAIKEYNDEEGIEITETVTINLIAYTSTRTLEGQVVAGSDMITATYTVEEQGGDEDAYGLTAVGATEETDEESTTYMQFTTSEPQFTITVPESAPEGWYATVVAYTFEGVAVEGDTLRAGNTTKTFSTLAEGTMYLCMATVYKADHTQLWANHNGNGGGGMLFKIAGEAQPDPTFTITAAGKNTMEDDVVVFDGVATFKMKAEGIAEGKDTNYQFKVDIFADPEDMFKVTDTKYFPVTDTIAELDELYNGEYGVDFYLQTKGVGGTWNAEGVAKSFSIKVTNYTAQVPVPDPTLTVTAAGKHTMTADTVVFDGNAAFRMKLEAAEGDTTTYTIMAQLFSKEAYNTMGEAITIYSYDAADTIAEFVGVYNGEYAVHFYAEKVYTLSGEPEEVEGTDFDFYFNVTNNAEPVYVDPEFTVAVAGKNTMTADTVVFDGAAAFKMKVGEMSAGDSLKIAAVLYTKTAYDAFGEPMTTFSYEATDTAAEFLGVWNGEYAVRFELQRYSLMLRDFALITDTVIYFNVTNYEEPVENYELTVKPVGAGENNTFTAAEVAFDMFVKGMTEADKDLLLYATIYTKAQYENFDSVGFTAMAAADSVRFTATLENGEYVGVFQLMRKGGRDTVATNAEDVTIEFTVKKNTANEAKELAGVSIYPNPTDGEFNVVAPANANVEIFNAAGVLVKRMVVAEGNAQIRLDNSGIYFVRVRANGQAAIKKVVVR